MSYDARGRRSNPNQWQQLLPLLQNDWSLTQYVTRGYTGHEPIDSMGLIHMNGRVYDPHLGRFTQADPFIQFPGSSQSYNRYSYVLNNPLAYTDPSGYSAWTKFRDKILKPVVAIVASYFTYNISSAWAVNAGLATEGGTMAGAIGGAAGGFVGGAINSGNLRGAASGAFGGMLFGAIGGHYGSLKGRDFWGWDGIASQGVAHGLAGGVMAELGGGKFGHGFAAAGVGFAGGAAGELGGLALEEQFVVATVAGGTASSLTGGKFANGALTSAFGFVFNQVQHRAAQKAQESNLATSYAESNGKGWVDEWGNVYPPDPNFHNPEPGLEGVYPEALLPIGRVARGVAHIGKASVAATGRFLGPKGPVFGNSFFRGHGNSGLLNHGKVRLGWSYNAKTDRLNFSLRVGRWHSDKYFNPISIEVSAD